MCTLDLRMLTSRRETRFLFAGAMNTVFGYSVYALLLYLGVQYLLALLLSTIAGVIFNYFSFGRIVFGNTSGWMGFVRFVIAYSIVYALNSLLLRVLVTGTGINPYLGQVLCIPPSVLLAWLLMNYWVYRKI